MSVNSLPKTDTRQCRGWDLNPGPSALESSMLISHSATEINDVIHINQKLTTNQLRKPPLPGQTRTHTQHNASGPICKIGRSRTSELHVPFKYCRQMWLWFAFDNVEKWRTAANRPFNKVTQLVNKTALTRIDRQNTICQLTNELTKSIISKPEMWHL